MALVALAGALPDPPPDAAPAAPLAFRGEVWLAAAFASGAALTLLDQPFAAVDKASMGVITGLLQEAATHPSRAWVVADHVAPAGVPLAAMIDLDAAS